MNPTRPSLSKQTPPKRPNDPVHEGAPNHPGASGNSNHPCVDPWVVSGPGQRGDCDCRPPPSKRSPRNAPPRVVPKESDCCSQLVKILQEHLGVEIPLHKPKQPTLLKATNWCAELPIKDSSVPLLMLVLRRHLIGASPENEFESNLRAWLTSLPPDRFEALRLGLEAYDELPSDIKDCLFETRFDDPNNACLLAPAFIGKVLRAELLTVAIKQVFPRSGGVEGPGSVRLWERLYHFASGKEFGETRMTLGPWPWICSIDPSGDGREIYRNNDVFVPGTLSPVIFQDYEFEKDCKVQSPPGESAGKVKIDCPRKSASEPAAPAAPPKSVTGLGAGGTGPSACSGGPTYRFDKASAPADSVPPWCLAVPVIYPGEGVALSGFNFFSTDCKVLVNRIDGSFPDIVIPCAVYGDTFTDATLDGKPAAVCDVNDIVNFTLPYEVRQGPNNVEVPPGRYSIQVIVANDIGYALEGGPAPASFGSNLVLVDVEPAADTKYRIWTERAACYETTPGWGADEPWFQAFTYRMKLVPSSPPLSAAITICNAEDVESWVTIPISPPVDLLSNESLGKLGIFAAGIVGVEVDSDDAARNSVKTFGAAYLEYLSRWYTELAGSGVAGISAPEVKILIDSGVMTNTLWGSAIALGVILALGVAYATWAPADPIGYDFFAYGNLRLSQLTDDKERTFSKVSDEVYGIGRYIIPVGPGKIFNPEHTAAVYTEEHQYLTDEKSQYGIRFQIKRTIT